MYVGRMTAAWDVASVVLACMHNWSPFGVKRALSPDEIHPLTAGEAAKRNVVRSPEQLHRAISHLPVRVMQAGSFRVEPRPTGGET